MPGAGRVAVAPQGAHLLSWCAEDGRERLYLSPEAMFDGHTPLRGGVPVCFPQFGRAGPLVAHGFARRLPWRRAPGPGFTWRLHDGAATRAVWPFAFDAELAFVLAPGRLRMVFTVHNAGPEPLAFTAALHTYLRVDDVAEARLEGLGTEVPIAAGVDRVFENAPPRLTLSQPSGPVGIAQGGGFVDTVVWNPGAEPFADLPADGHRRFACVEAACVVRPVVLAPAAVWSGWQELSVRTC